MTATYELGGLSVDVSCEEPSVAELVGSRFRSLRTADTRTPDLVVEVRGPGSDRSWPPEPAGVGRPIYDAPSTQIDYFDASDQLFVDYEHRARLLCTPGQGLIQLSITGSEPGDEVLATHPLLTIALVETMKRFQRFPLHAAGLALHGKGVLVPGASGSGKSTTSVTLVRAGFDFLSDDTVFLTSSPDGIWVAGFPDEVDVTDNTVARIPELGHLAGASLVPGREKHSFRVEDVFGITPLTGCRPAVLIAPQVVAGPRSEVEPLAPSEALIGLLPNVLLTDPVASQAHLDMLAALVESVPCMTFRVGSDLDAAVACVTDLVS
ncbi:MAG: hypothetical protein ABSC41_02840 [Acidimicrobiales bacterium]